MSFKMFIDHVFRLSEHNRTQRYLLQLLLIALGISLFLIAFLPYGIKTFPEIIVCIFCGLTVPFILAWIFFLYLFIRSNIYLYRNHRSLWKQQWTHSLQARIEVGKKINALNPSHVYGFQIKGSLLVWLFFSMWFFSSLAFYLVYVLILSNNP